jgi:hypothetical protein
VADSIVSGNYECLRDLEKNPDKVHFVIQASRLGGRLFIVKLEYENYPPRTAKNKDYDLTIAKWPDDDWGLLWFVVSIPKKDYNLAEQVAKETGLRIADGVPTIIDMNGCVHFPISGPTVFSLESNAKSKVYDNDPDEIQRQLKAEDAECELIIQNDVERINLELRQEGYTDEQIVRIWQNWNEGKNHTEEPNGNI